MSNVKVVGKDSKGNDVTVFVKKPNAKDFREAKLYSNSSVASMIHQKNKEGKPAFLIRSQVKDYLRAAGIWSDEQEQKVISIGKTIAEKEKSLMSGGIKKSAGKNIALELIDLRSEQLRLLSKIHELDEFTVEAVAENSEFDYLFSLCLLNEEGNRIFESVDLYKESASEEPYYFTAAQELQTLIYGFGKTEDILKDRTEYKFLQKFGFINEKMQLVNPDGKLVDRDGKLIDVDGNFVDGDGNKVDRDGNPLDKDGKRVVEFGEFLDD